MNHKWPPITEGQKYGHLTVIDFAGKDKHGNDTWLCKCECGNKKVVRGGYLKNGMTKSCGCHKNENHLKHGDSKTRLYHIWHGIIRRTEDCTRKEYRNYGGRGIKMCQEWRESYEKFREWALHNGYSENCSIDRIDNDGDYSSSNCRWLDRLGQANNRTDTCFLTVNGTTKSVSDWARDTGIPYARLKKRFRLGWPAERILT